MPSYVIVGASKGLGYQFLKTLSANPANKVVGTARNQAATQAQANADGLTGVKIVHGDLDNAASLQAAAKEAADFTGGAVDHLIINGAYLSFDTQFLKPTDFIGKDQFFADELKQAIQTNVTGTLFAINAFLPYVRKSSIKKIVAISSGHADIEIIQLGLPETIPYALSKVALNMLVAKYAVELKPEGIILLALSPGFVETHPVDLSKVDDQTKAVYLDLFARFQKYEPAFKGPIQPPESVEKQLQVIHNLTIDQTGEFLSHHGTKRWFNEEGR